MTQGLTPDEKVKTSAFLPSAQTHQRRDGPYATPSGNSPQMFDQWP